MFFCFQCAFIVPVFEILCCSSVHCCCIALLLRFFLVIKETEADLRQFAFNLRQCARSRLKVALSGAKFDNNETLNGIVGVRQSAFYKN